MVNTGTQSRARRVKANMQRDRDHPAQYQMGLEIIFNKCESVKRMSGNI